MFKILRQMGSVLLLLALLAGLPEILFDDDGIIRFEPERLVSQAALLITDFAHGTLGSYILGKNERQIMEDIFPFAQQSFVLLFSSLFISVLITLLIGVFFHRFKVARYLEKVIGWLSIIPDFVIVLYSMVAATSFYQLTGIRIITLSPLDESRSLWLPIVILSITPTTYLLKIVSLQYYQIRGQDYVKTAMSKGLSIPYMNMHHVFKNLMPYFVSDLKKAISITLPNLFLVEYLLNVMGITHFVFSNHYQFSLAFIGFLVLIPISLLTYTLLRVILILFQKGFIYE